MLVAEGRSLSVAKNTFVLSIRLHHEALFSIVLLRLVTREPE